MQFSNIFGETPWCSHRRVLACSIASEAFEAVMRISTRLQVDKRRVSETDTRSFMALRNLPMSDLANESLSLISMGAVL